ncbi:MAG: aminomethyl-transferring glycine dehydrogenase subunit GcvPA [Anaerolineales bacterium]|jgi:glycine dehydrogenase subunit 1
MFHPHTESNREEMLNTIGVKSLAQLFEDVPKEFRFPKLNLPPALTEMEALEEVEILSEGNETFKDMPMFLGAGAYNHYIPAAVDSILSRGEFYTAYTPYQPEISQGTLQAIFEYQSHIVNLTGMDVSNASHYDGATAAAEAVNMAMAIFRNKRKKVVISSALHPHYTQTIETYIRHADIEIAGQNLDIGLGPESLYDFIDDNTAIVIVQYPDFFGRIYDYAKLAEKAHQVGALLGVGVNPMILALLRPPGEFGADIVFGEGQPLGIPLSYGGPYLGLLATKDEYVRTIAGRLVGETVDDKGQIGYVLTLSTREQHIRREKAISNICTNQGLMALAASVYLSLVGKEGLKEVANLCYQKAHYAANQISLLPGYKLWSDIPFFHEFVIECSRPSAEINTFLLENGIIGGYDIGKDFSGLGNCILFAVTEMNSKDQIDDLVSLLGEASHG